MVFTPEERRERRRLQQVEYRKSYPDRVKAARQKYDRANPDRWRITDPEKAQAKTKKDTARKKRWAVANPEKARAAEERRKLKMREATRLRREAAGVARVKIKAGVKPRVALGELLGRRLSQNAVYSAAWNAVPRGLPRDVRDDVISSIVLAVFEGEIGIEEIAANARKYLTAHNPGRFKTVSIDGVIPGTDNIRLIDTIADDAIHF